MRSGKSSVQGWKTGEQIVAVLMILRALGPAAGWAQEPAQSRIEEETSKQKKIYQSRGADVPDGYVTNRGLSNYAGFAFLPASATARWAGWAPRTVRLDIVFAGAGQAILDYYAPPDAAAPTEKCARPGGLAQRSRGIHRGPPDGRVAPAGREPRRTYTVSQRQDPAALFARRARKISDYYRCVRRLLLYRRLVPVHGKGTERCSRSAAVFIRSCSTSI